MKLLPAIAIIPVFVLGAPPEIDPQDLARFERLVAPRILPSVEGEKNFAAADVLNDQTDERVSSYLEQIDQTILIDQKDAPASAEEEEDPFAGIFEPGAGKLIITNSKGIYLDGKTNEVVYLGSVKVQGQGMQMTCKKDLKALFHPPEEKKEEEKKDSLTKFGGFGELKQFTASGEVLISGENDDGRKFYVRGDRALYEMQKEGEKIHSTVTFRGDKLFFMLGDPNDKEAKEKPMALRSISKDATAVVTLKDKTVQVRLSDQGWITFIGLPESDEEKEKKQK